MADDVRGFEGEDVEDGLLDFGFVGGVGAEGVDVDGDGLWVADGVGELYFAAFCEAGGDDIFCDIPAHVGSGAVHFGGVFA